MTGSGGAPRGVADGGPGPVRIEATPGRRRVATVLQVAVVLATVGLVVSGARILVALWPSRADPAVGQVWWLFAGLLLTSTVTLGWLVLLIRDLATVAILVDLEGVTVVRLLRGFRARWDEVEEVGLVERSGHLTLRARRGAFTTTRQLLGPGPFDALVSHLRAGAGPAVRAWGPWAAARRQFARLALPAAGALILWGLGRRLSRRAPAGGDGG